MVCDMEKASPFAEWLRRIIAESGYTNDVFGELIDASSTSLDAWLSGERKPAAVGRLLLEYLGQSPDFLSWLEERYERKRGHPPRKRLGAPRALAHRGPNREAKTLQMGKDRPPPLSRN